MTYEEIMKLKVELDKLYAKAEWHTPSYTDEQIAIDSANREMQIVLINNYIHQVLVDVYPKIARTWNSYEGKKFGPKTQDKVWRELRAIANQVGLEWFTPHSYCDRQYTALELKMHFHITKYTVDYKIVHIDAKLTDSNNKMLVIAEKIPEIYLKRYPYIPDAEAYINGYHKNMENLRVAKEIVEQMQKSIRDNYSALA